MDSGPTGHSERLQVHIAGPRACQKSGFSQAFPVIPAQAPDSDLLPKTKCFTAVMEAAAMLLLMQKLLTAAL